MSRAIFEAGETIFLEGDKSRDAYWIRSGAVAISVKTPEGEQTLAQLGVGEIFGEMGMIDDRPRSATAAALEPTVLEVITESDFEERVLGNPTLLRGYLGTLFERLRTADSLLQVEMSNRPKAPDEAKAPEPSASVSIEAILAGPAPRTILPEPRDLPKPAGDTTQKVTLASQYDKTGWKGAPVRVQLDKFPYRIGRATSDGLSAFVLNDLALEDEAPYRVSRNHCSIEKRGDLYVVRDRGSSVGTIVNGEVIGLDAGNLRAELKEGENEIILGGEAGPHHFVLTIEG